MKNFKSVGVLLMVLGLASTSAFAIHADPPKSSYKSASAAIDVPSTKEDKEGVLEAESCVPREEVMDGFDAGVEKTISAMESKWMGPDSENGLRYGFRGAEPLEIHEQFSNRFGIELKDRTTPRADGSMGKNIEVPCFSSREELSAKLQEVAQEMLRQEEIVFGKAKQALNLSKIACEDAKKDEASNPSQNGKCGKVQELECQTPDREHIAHLRLTLRNRIEIDGEESVVAINDKDELFALLDGGDASEGKSYLAFKPKNNPDNGVGGVCAEEENTCNGGSCEEGSSGRVPASNLKSEE